MNNQPTSGNPLAKNNQWTSGLCSCMEDGNSVCLTLFCPCVTFGRIADIADEGKTGCGRCGIFYGLICFVVGLPCLFSCTYRTKIRSKFGLPESPASDCVTHCFCECCALCQEYRELNNRGLDPSIGWSGNMQRTTAPPKGQDMTPPKVQDMGPPKGQDKAPPKGQDKAPPPKGQDKAPPPKGQDMASPKGQHKKG